MSEAGVIVKDQLPRCVNLTFVIQGIILYGHVIWTIVAICIPYGFDVVFSGRAKLLCEAVVKGAIVQAPGGIISLGPLEVQATVWIPSQTRKLSNLRRLAALAGEYRSDPWCRSGGE